MEPRLTVPTKIVEKRADGVELEIDLSLEGGVVVQGSSTEQPCSDNVVVQVRLERNEGLDFTTFGNKRQQ